MESEGIPQDRVASVEPEHPHGYTLADAEMERINEKAHSGDVLDPLALDDPTGASVEGVVARVGLAIILVAVVGILFAQVACKNMRLSAVPDFTNGATAERVESALDHGVLWGSSIVNFSTATELTSIDEKAGAIVLTVTDDTSRSLDQVLAQVQGPATALAMNMFEDLGINQVSYSVLAHVSQETGKFSTKGHDPLGEVLTIVWRRDASATDAFSCEIKGYDPLLAITGSEGI